MDTAAYQRGSAVLDYEVPSARRTEFDRIYRSDRAVIQRHLVYLTGERQLAEDLTQEAFSRLYERGLSERGEGPDNPRAWLLTVASNLAYNHFRSENRRATRESNSAARVESIQSDLDEGLDVRAALALLEPRDRMVLLLRGSGFTYAEIAETVGLAPTSIGTILARAQRRFREAYEGGIRPAEKE